jgi:GT2 family glycosyltransferase
MKLGIISCVRAVGDAVAMFHSFGPNRLLDVYEAVNYSSIGRGYNQGLIDVPISNDVLLFTHNDVTYWGSQNLLRDAIRAAAEPGIGFVGVAGRSSQLTDKAVWWDDPKHLRGAVAHQNGGHQKYMTSFGMYGTATVMDGVLLMCHRRVFEKIGLWDESLGFHFYDLDITLRAHRAGLKNLVLPLPILHESVGNLSPEWEASRQKFLDKHQIDLILEMAKK